MKLQLTLETSDPYKAATWLRSVAFELDVGKHSVFKPGEYQLESQDKSTIGTLEIK